jgi:cell division septal protein FtsQ
MHYQGSKVPLSEKNSGFKSAGIPLRSPWGSRYATVSSRREKKEENKFSFRMFVPASKPETKPVGTNYAFYRPGATAGTATFPETGIGFKNIFGNRNISEDSGSSKEKKWKTPSLSWDILKFLRWSSVVILLILAGWWGKQRAVGALQDSSNLKLVKVMVEGAHYLTQDEVLKTAGLTPGDGMFKVDLEDLNQKLKKLSWVDQVFVERRLPSSILISIRERKPVALLDNGNLYGVDKEGRILNPSDALLNQDLPLISGVSFSADAVGTTQTAQILKPALDFFSFMTEKDGVLAHDVSEVNLSEPESLKVTFINGTQVTFNTTVSDTDLKRMALVLGDLNEKGKKASTMDFRYKDMAFVRTR